MRDRQVLRHFPCPRSVSFVVNRLGPVVLVGCLTALQLVYIGPFRVYWARFKTLNRRGSWPHCALARHPHGSLCATQSIQPLSVSNSIVLASFKAQLFPTPLARTARPQTRANWAALSSAHPAQFAAAGVLDADHPILDRVKGGRATDLCVNQARLRLNEDGIECLGRLGGRRLGANHVESHEGQEDEPGRGGRTNLEVARR